MKVNFVGNVCNNHYVYAKGLREYGVDAHLYLTPADLSCIQSLPLNENKNYKEDYPYWIHVIERESHFHPFKYIPKKITHLILNADLIQTDGLYAHYFINKNIPVLIRPYGADFFFEPFKINIKLNLLHPFFWLRRYKIRKGYKDSTAIILPNYNPVWKIGYQRLLKNKKLAIVPLSIDTNLFNFGYKTDSCFNEMFPNGNFFVFQSARQVWTKQTIEKEGGAKMNNILINAFAQFVKKAPDAILVLIDGRGGDVEKSKLLITELGIDTNIRWIEPVKRYQLIKYLYSADVFVDSLGSTYGSACLEAMSCGVPSLVSLDDRQKKIIGSIPPVFNVSTVDEVTDVLIDLYSNHEKYKKLPYEIREYVVSHHSKKIISKKLLSLYEHLIFKRLPFPFISQDFFI